MHWRSVLKWNLVFVSLFVATAAAAQTDPLSSWHDRPAKQAIVGFVKKTTTQGSPQFIAPAERIAVFDNDGTLWAEQPIYFQFALRARPRQGARAAASGVEGQGAVRFAAQGRPEGTRWPAASRRSRRS